jgi:hypothetical protein
MTSIVNLDIKPDANGVRGMSAQSRLDAAGTALFVEWFSTVFKAPCLAVSKKLIQLRGIDLAVRLSLPGVRSSVGVDLKIDTHDRGNMTFEVHSQDRGNTIRNGPAPGWPRKDMPWVAYYFLKTGEVVFLDMSRVTPWLNSLLQLGLNGSNPGSGDCPFWLSGTPNSTYSSYNIVARITDVLKHCPGTYYLRLTDHAPVSLLQEHTGSGGQAPMINAAQHPTTSPIELQQHMSKSMSYLVKPQFSADEDEILLRWAERNARFSAFPGVKERGLLNQSSRIHRYLKGDALPKIAA